MTREEAIKYLQYIGMSFVPTDQYGDYDDPRPYEEALDMAIEALQTDTDCSTCRHNDKEWDSEECDSCCGNNSHYEPKGGDDE